MFLFLLQCPFCDHEWQSRDEDDLCACCGQPGFVLQAPRPEDDWDARILKAILQESCWHAVR
jgi:hypothetical protein